MRSLLKDEISVQRPFQGERLATELTSADGGNHGQAGCRNTEPAEGTPPKGCNPGHAQRQLPNKEPLPPSGRAAQRSAPGPAPAPRPKPRPGPCRHFRFGEAEGSALPGAPRGSLPPASWRHGGLHWPGQAAPVPKPAGGYQV